MANIIDEILKQIPDSDKNISDSVFEGANIILYTKNKDFYFSSNGLIKKPPPVSTAPPPPAPTPNCGTNAKPVDPNA